MQVLKTHVVERAVIAPFEHSPKALHAVSMSLAVYPFAQRVLYGFVVFKTCISRILVRKLLGLRVGMLADKAL